MNGGVDFTAGLRSHSSVGGGFASNERAAVYEEAAIEDAVAVGYTFIATQGAAAALSYSAVQVSDQLWIRPGFELSVGGRLGFFGRLVDGYCFEGFAGLSVVPHFPVAVDAKIRTA